MTYMEILLIVAMVYCMAAGLAYLRERHLKNYKLSQQEWEFAQKCFADGHERVFVRLRMPFWCCFEVTRHIRVTRLNKPGDSLSLPGYVFGS